MRILPPVYFFLAIGCMVLVHFVLPGRRWGGTSSLGTVLLLAGFCLAVWGRTLFKKHGTPVKPFENVTVLVTEGPYRFTRNPMYLGMVTGLMGVGFLLGSLLPLLVVPVFAWLITTRFIVKEEVLLLARFGQSYQEYKQRVRRWL